MRSFISSIVLIVIAVTAFASIIVGLYSIINYLNIGFIGQMLKLASWAIALVWWVMIIMSTKTLFQQFGWMRKDKPKDIFDYFK